MNHRPAAQADGAAVAVDVVLFLAHLRASACRAGVTSSIKPPNWQPGHAPPSSPRRTKLRRARSRGGLSVSAAMSQQPIARFWHLRGGGSVSSLISGPSSRRRVDVIGPRDLGRRRLACLASPTAGRLAASHRHGRSSDADSVAWWPVVWVKPGPGLAFLAAITCCDWIWELRYNCWADACMAGSLG